ncbi:hypothetical protein H1P_6890001 [Hyella patelloides LEGE 07179]|uniref:Uncharacterized protein n=1 Tax=Hyella patelloides LEGE 07179 TaxID=945734 RepID=A0A563W2Z2_9CYAN|nr:hypothetical protein H1P_6890001 [Hyella patelloides LEGE 07179]
MPLIWFDACFIHDRISWFENETALPINTGVPIRPVKRDNKDKWNSATVLQKGFVTQTKDLSACTVARMLLDRDRISSRQLLLKL